MGGDRTNRVDWSEENIIKLVEKYKHKDIMFYSPVSEKVYDTKAKWKNSIAVKMSKISANLFFFLLEPPTYSKLSGEQLTLQDYDYLRGFGKYTKYETKNFLFRKLRDYTQITDETRHKKSVGMKKFYDSTEGRKFKDRRSKEMKYFYTTEEGLESKKLRGAKASVSMKHKIAQGTFTPPITNTWTHWNASITIDGKTKKFRSSWEACVWYCNQHLEYETIRVPSITSQKVFIIDFYDRDANIIYEIKPHCRYNLEVEKMSTFINYCRVNKINFVWINEFNIHQYISHKLIEQNESALIQYSKLKKIYVNNIKD